MTQATNPSGKLADVAGTLRGQALLLQDGELERVAYRCDPSAAALGAITTTRAILAHLASELDRAATQMEAQP